MQSQSNKKQHFSESGHVCISTFFYLMKFGWHRFCETSKKKVQDGPDT
jgi:hypothetical protein